jgi:hypothetical protein
MIHAPSKKKTSSNSFTARAERFRDAKVVCMNAPSLQKGKGAEKLLCPKR